LAKKKRQKEKTFLTELRHSFEELGCFWYKITDSPVSALLGSRFESAKPFDAILVYEGIPIAVEAKSLKDYQAFGLRHLRPSQVKGLEDFEAAGGRSLVLVNIRRAASRASGVKRLNQLMAFHWPELRDRGESFKKGEMIERRQWTGTKKRFPVGEILALVSESVISDQRSIRFY